MCGRRPRVRPLPAALVSLLAIVPVSARAEAGPSGHVHGGASTPAEQPATASEPISAPANGVHSDHPTSNPAAGAAEERPASIPDSGAAQAIEPMGMGRMQSGRAPADARDPNAYADGYRNSTLPGFETTDRLGIGMLLVDQLELVSGTDGKGLAWSLQLARGGDTDKLWLRSQGLKTAGERVDPSSGVEALWWHATAPFWGRVLGVRQDLGRGARTWLAAGIEGLAPYWFDVELTGYVSDAGHVSARARASYDLLVSNRLILTPAAETNLFSRKQADRRLGAGLANVELALRLRYEIRRKLAPYVGVVWERALGSTADYRRIDRDPVTERRLVAGVRWWL